MTIRRNNNAFANSRARGGAWPVLWGMCLALLLSGASAQGKTGLIAHASDDTLWIGVIGSADKSTEEDTTFRYRSTNTADQTWREMPGALVGRVVQMTHTGQTVVTLVSTGEWDLLWPSGDSVGPSLPDRSKMIAIASDRDLIYAIGLAGAEPQPTTNTSASTASPNSPATTQTTQPSEASATTEPSATTRPLISTDLPILYIFQDGSWQRQANCPPTLATSPGDISLSIVDRKPMLAQMDAAGAINVFELADDKQWVERGKITPETAPHAIKLLSGTQRPILWADTGTPGGTLYLGGDAWEKPVQLSLSSPVKNAVDRTVVQAGGSIRLILADDKGKLYEQRYDAAGQRNGNVVALETPQPSLPPILDSWPMMVLMAALAFVMLSSVRRQPPQTATQNGKGEPDALVLAPSGQRLLAAMIDAIPLLVAAIYVLSNDPNPTNTTNLSITLPPLLIAMGIYILHTTITELVAGRSLGKMIISLRVVGIDGATPRKSALLLRNLFRIFDLIPLPLGVLVLITPLRQRVGDMVARTVVIVMTEPLVEDDEEPNHSR